MDRSRHGGNCHYHVRGLCLESHQALKLYNRVGHDPPYTSDQLSPYFPCQFGLRFSANANGPSLTSSE